MSGNRIDISLNGTDPGLQSVDLFRQGAGGDQMQGDQPRGETDEETRPVDFLNGEPDRMLVCIVRGEDAGGAVTTGDPLPQQVIFDARTEILGVQVARRTDRHLPSWHANAVKSAPTSARIAMCA